MDSIVFSGGLAVDFYWFSQDLVWILVLFVGFGVEFIVFRGFGVDCFSVDEVWISMLFAYSAWISLFFGGFAVYFNFARCIWQ